MNQSLKKQSVFYVQYIEWHGVKVGPGLISKFKIGTPGPPSKFKSGTPRPPAKFKSGTFVIIFLHCLTYFVLDKYIYNKEIIFHEATFFDLNSSTISVNFLMSDLVCLIW